MMLAVRAAARRSASVALLPSRPLAISATRLAASEVTGGAAAGVFCCRRCVSRYGFVKDHIPSAQNSSACTAAMNSASPVTMATGPCRRGIAAALPGPRLICFRNSRIAARFSGSPRDSLL